MVLVRLVQEGNEGKVVYTELVRLMWEDVDAKSKKLGVLYHIYTFAGAFRH